MPAARRKLDADAQARIGELPDSRTDRIGRPNAGALDEFLESGRPTILRIPLRHRSQTGSLPGQHIDAIAWGTVEGGAAEPAEIGMGERRIVDLHRDGQAGRCDGSARQARGRQFERLRDRIAHPADDLRATYDLWLDHARAAHRLSSLPPSRATTRTTSHLAPRAIA